MNTILIESISNPIRTIIFILLFCFLSYKTWSGNNGKEEETI